MNRVLVYTPTVNRGGVHRVVATLTAALARAGGQDWHFAVLGQKYDEIGLPVRYPADWQVTQLAPLKDGQPLPAHPAQFPFLMQHADTFVSHLRAVAADYDLIYCPVIWWTMRVPTWDITTPVVGVVQDFAFDHLDMGILANHFREVARLAAQRLTATVFMSDFQRQHGETVYGFQRTHVIRHSGDFVTDSFDPGPEQIERVSRKYGLPGQYVLAFHPMHHKDPVTILRAQHYARQRSSAVPPLVMAGVNTHLLLNDDPADAHLQQVRRVLREIGARPGVDFFALGLVEEGDIGGLYGGACVSITASRSEGDLPGNIFEAARAWTPVIYSDFPVLTERLGTAGRYGLCFPVGDYRALGELLINTCEDPSAARARAEALFGLLNARTVDDVAREYLALFAQVIAGVPRSSSTDCRADDGVTVGIIDALMTLAQLLKGRNLQAPAVVEALRDLRASDELKGLLT